MTSIKASMSSDKHRNEEPTHSSEISATDIIRGLHLLRESEFRKHGLTYRERQVANRILDGNNIASIALSLHLSVSAVKYHIRRIYKKVGAESKSDFSRIIRHGMSDSQLRWHDVSAMQDAIRESGPRATLM